MHLKNFALPEGFRTRLISIVSKPIKVVFVVVVIAVVVFVKKIVDPKIIQVQKF